MIIVRMIETCESFVLRHERITFLVSVWDPIEEDNRVIEFIASVGLHEERFSKIINKYSGSVSMCMAITKALIADQEAHSVPICASISDFRNGSTSAFGLYVNQTNPSDIQLCIRYPGLKIVVIQCVPSEWTYPTAEPYTCELFMHMPDEIEAILGA